MSAPRQTLAFAGIVSATCALLVTAVAVWTRPYREANERAAELRTVMEALDIPLPAHASARELLARFEQSVHQKTVSNLVIYVYIPAGGEQAEAVAIPFSGPGLWGPLAGVVALRPDLQTIRGLRFYRHAETPGLGGQIDSPEFQRRFVGKSLVPRPGIPPLRIVQPGTAGGANRVDGITGATMTCNRLEAILNKLGRRLEHIP